MELYYLRAVLGTGGFVFDNLDPFIRDDLSDGDVIGHRDPFNGDDLG